jgi:hypothetical protein
VVKRMKFIVLLLAALMLLGACSSDGQEGDAPQPTATSRSITGMASVEAVEVVVSDTSPVQVSLVVEGLVADSCTAIDQIEQTRAGGRFLVSITTIKAAGINCEPEPQSFTEMVILAVEELPAGIYTVDVNGVGASFTLQADNVVDEGNAVISGRVWHDLCAIGGGDGQVDVTPSEGCVPVGDYYQANGLLDAGEPGLGGIVVNLGQGGCPNSGLAATITDGEGVFLFSGLMAGTYCLSINTQDEQNESSLLPGQWTYPAGGEGLVTVELAPGENRSDLNFGWDYQFLPAPATGGGLCSDKAFFIQDVTIPDDTVLTPGETFTKTWQLRNDGTCTWGAGYSLVFFTGDQMDGPDVVPLPEEVAPGGVVDLNVVLVAPAAAGTYRGEWILRNAGGILFGIGEAADTAFWLQIVVTN